MVQRKQTKTKTKQEVCRTNVSKQRKKAAESFNKNAPEVCVLRTYGKPCKYCKEANRLKSKEDKEDRDLGYKIGVRSTYYMNVVDLDHKADGVRIYGSGIENWRTLVDLLPEEDDDGALDFTNPDEACAVIIKRRGTSMTNTKYVLKLGSKTFEVPSKWLKGVYDLSDVLEIIDDADFELWKPREGPNNLLILGPWGKSAEGDFYKEAFYHWNVNDMSSGEEEEDDESGGVDDDAGEFEDDAFDGGVDDSDGGGNGGEDDDFEY